MQKQNDLLISKGLPFYEKIKRSISNDGQTFIWYDKTKNSSEFITGMELAHTTVGHPLYKDLSKSGYELVSGGDGCCKLAIWVIREKKKQTAIGDIRVSFDSAEENALMIDGFQKVDVNLRDFDLPEMYLFVKRVDKLDTAEALNTNAILAEAQGLQKIMKERPDDVALKGLYKRVHEKLLQAYRKETDAEISNPLQYAIELMALNQKELKQWMRVFESIDTERKARISLEDVFMWLEIPPTSYSKHVFKLLDALDASEQLEFGDFVRSIGTYCFFGREEILRCDDCIPSMIL
jgi:hypothetical protein